jgi:hypothetical protein
MMCFLEWISLLNEINVKKLIEDKLINNNRAMNTIGRPIQINFNLNDDFNKINEFQAKVILNIIFICKIL